MPDYTISPVFLFLAILLAAAILFTLDHWRRGRMPLAQSGGDVVLLFRDEALVDSAGEAEGLLRMAGPAARSLSGMLRILARSFPDLDAEMDRAAAGGARRLSGGAEGESLQIERWRDFTRLTLLSRQDEDRRGQIRLAAIEDEVASIRAIAENAPQPIWRQDREGVVIWANRAYLALSDRLADGPRPTRQEIGPLPWPSAPIFGLVAAEDGPTTARRIALPSGPDGQTQWFEVTFVRHDDHVVGFATDATPAVIAESDRQTILQTLTKTFALLQSGLAIFDRQRRLILFNPAFLDMTRLPVEFLSSRPLVHSVLDRLRNMQMLPEPKNYRSWREQIAALEAATALGAYSETWELPMGQTFRVTGWAHSDGTLAFVFEDISDEVTANRRLRAEQTTAQAVIDHLPQAVAVFSVAGTLTLSNAGYDRLWRCGDFLEDRSLTTEIARWRAAAAEAGATDWAALAGRAALTGATAGRVETAIDLQPRGVWRLRLSPLPGAETLVEFLPDPGTAPCGGAPAVGLSADHDAVVPDPDTAR